MDDKLFYSAAGMAGAERYNDWTFSLFGGLVRGDVLEVGCGVGTFTGRIIERCSFDRLLGIDVSEDAVEYCRKRFERPGVELRRAPVERIEGKFDSIICMNVLEHISDDRAALKHILNLLSPGGTLFLLVPAHQFLFSSFDEASGHYRRYGKGRMRALIADASGGRGFRVTQFYFNIIGAVGYFLVYRVLHKAPRENAGAEIGLFDALVVPVMSRLECRCLPLGISLVSIVTKEKEESGAS